MKSSVNTWQETKVSPTFVCVKSSQPPTYAAPVTGKVQFSISPAAHLPETNVPSCPPGFITPPPRHLPSHPWRGLSRGAQPPALRLPPVPPAAVPRRPLPRRRLRPLQSVRPLPAAPSLLRLHSFPPRAVIDADASVSSFALHHRFRIFAPADGFQFAMIFFSKITHRDSTHAIRNLSFEVACRSISQAISFRSRTPPCDSRGHC